MLCGESFLLTITQVYALPLKSLLLHLIVHPLPLDIMSPIVQLYCFGILWFIQYAIFAYHSQHHPKLLRAQSLLGLQIDHTTTPSNYILNYNNLQVWLFNLYGLVGIFLMCF